MKKNIIRLTEAELKQYISKVVAEQTAPAAPVDMEAEKAKVNPLRTSLVGKNVQLYLDPSKTKKSHIVKVESIGFSTKIAGVYYIGVKDLSFVTPTGGAAEPQDNLGQVTNLRFDCTEPDQLMTMVGGRVTATVYCPPFTELFKQGVACKTVDHRPDFAAAKPAAPAAVAPKADLA